MFPIKTVYYIQRIHHDQELCYMIMPDTEETISSMSSVLSNYNERYVRIGSRILVPLKLLLDMDSLRNYTAKAGIPCPDKRFVKHGCTEYDLWIEIVLPKEKGEEDAR